MHESEKWKWSRSVVSDPQRPHGLQLTRLLCPWDSPGKSTGVGCHCLIPRYYLILSPWHSTLSYPCIQGLPWWLIGEESTCQCRRCRFYPWVGKILWRRIWQPTTAREIPWTEESGGLQCMGSQKNRHDLVTKHWMETPLHSPFSTHPSHSTVTPPSLGCHTQALVWRL